MAHDSRKTGRFPRFARAANPRRYTPPARTLLRLRRPRHGAPWRASTNWTDFATSLAVAGRALLFGLPLAILAAWALSRSTLPGKSVLDAAVHLPLVLPPVLVGFFLLVILPAART